MFKSILDSGDIEEGIVREIDLDGKKINFKQISNSGVWSNATLGAFRQD